MKCEISLGAWEYSQECVFLLAYICSLCFGPQMLEYSFLGAERKLCLCVGGWGLCVCVCTRVVLRCIFAYQINILQPLTFFFFTTATVCFPLADGVSYWKTRPYQLLLKRFTVYVTVSRPAYLPLLTSRLEANRGIGKMIGRGWLSLASS